MAIKETHMGTEIIPLEKVGKRTIYRYEDHSVFGLPKYCVFHRDLFIENAKTIKEARKIAREVI